MTDIKFKGNVRSCSDHPKNGSTLQDSKRCLHSNDEMYDDDSLSDSLFIDSWLADNWSMDSSLTDN